MPRAAAIATLILVSAAACGQDNPGVLAPSDADKVSATVVAEGVRISNGTSTAVAYIIWNKGFLGLFAPCIDPGPSCLRLPARQAVVVPFADIVGYSKTPPETVVYWWTVSSNGEGGYRIEKLHQITLLLQ